MRQINKPNAGSLVWRRYSNVAPPKPPRNDPSHNPARWAARCAPGLIQGLANWLCYSARTTTDKILAIVLPIAAFSAAGFEHSIANMYLLTFALLTKFWAATMFWGLIGKIPSAFPHLTVFGALMNLVWVTIGNMIGCVVVGITYWFSYLRKPESGSPRG
ncbi:formate/nitrite transporter family protein [Bradyrhizobium sp. CSA112]|uniref:formate/nitrite transporter family protein n=1 Tax=Bradyrhizobium sp. CSA112 TaxID=2699170 RepID=UPI0023B103D4|nr:formate/nitrite transporter family protein [Bradyrhizobium sp. CSA112]